jgi:hypothetical protein
MYRNVLFALLVAAALWAGVAGYGLWHAGRQLAGLPSAMSPAPESPGSTAEGTTESYVAVRLPENRSAAPAPARSTAGGQQTARRDASIRAQRRWMPPVNETPVDRASLEALLDDPDPEIRAEAAALIELFDTEGALER